MLHLVAVTCSSRPGGPDWVCGMGDGMQDGRRPNRPASIFASAVAVAFGAAITYNAMLGQGAGRHNLAAAEGATTRLKVDIPTGGRTIQLKYDPVIEGVQRQLYASGYYKGSIDGVLGKKTRAAIQAYQRAVGIEVTGEPSEDLVEHIKFTREVSQASVFTGSVEPAADADARAEIRRVQTGLAELAYSPGEINGEMSEDTRRAIADFQRDRKLPETGEITPDLMAELVKMSGQSEIAGD